MGSAPAKLEALNELIHFDHIYTKPVEVVCEESEVEVKIEEAVEEEVVEVEAQSVCVKEEVEEVDIPESCPNVDEYFSTASPTLCGGFDDTPCLADAYSDSGYERSPSPFSNMSSPLCPEGSWDDVFANELFPQLISV